MSIQTATGVREADLPWVDIGVRPGYNQRYHGFFNKQRKVAARIGSLYAEPTTIRHGTGILSSRSATCCRGK